MTSLDGLSLAPADGTLGPCPGQISRAGTHYRIDGPEDGPLTLLINGLGDFSYRWERMAAALVATGRRVLRYDQYGKGWSRAPQGQRYDAAAFHGQICDLLDELHLADRGVTVIGHSMGGVIAAVFATLRPDTVRELVLLAPAGAMRSPIPFFRTVQAVVRSSPSVLVPLVARMTAGPPPTPGDFCGPDATRLHDEWDCPWIMASRRANGNYAFGASAANMPMTTLEQHLASLDKPPPSPALRVLLLTGESDTVVRDVDADFWRRAFASASEVRVEPPLRGHHCFHIEFPEGERLVLDFLAASSAVR